MNTHSSIKHGNITEQIIRVFYDVYNELGHGFIESVYQKSFVMALTSKGLSALPKIDVPVWFRGQKVASFEADILVNQSVLLELKACRTLNPAHEVQLLNYLKATDIEVGMLFNFGVRPEFKRMAFDNSRKRGGSVPPLSINELLKES